MLRKLDYGKRGDATDYLTFLIISFIFGIVLFVFAYVVPQITGGLTTAGLNNTPEGSNAINGLEDFGSITLQRGFFLLMVGLIASTLITSFLIRAHPVFFFIYLFMLIVTLFVGTYLGNAFETFATNPVFAQTIDEQSLITIFFENIIRIILGMAALSFIIIFAKFSSGGASVQGQL